MLPLQFTDDVLTKTTIRCVMRSMAKSFAFVQPTFSFHIDFRTCRLLLAPVWYIFVVYCLSNVFFLLLRSPKKNHIVHVIRRWTIPTSSYLLGSSEWDQDRVEEKGSQQNGGFVHAFIMVFGMDHHLKHWTRGVLVVVVVYPKHDCIHNSIKLIHNINTNSSFSIILYTNWKIYFPIYLWIFCAT